MIRVGVVEDEPLHRHALLEYLERFQAEESESLEVVSYSSATELLANSPNSFDILLLDIQMDDLDGISAARKIRETDREVVIVFITSSPQFAIKGYEVNALSYLLKPLPYFAFSEELKRSIAKVRRRSLTSVSLPDGAGIRKVTTRDIVYAESSRHRVIVHLLDGEVTYTGALRDLETRLASHGFQRCNSGYLVNLSQVISTKGYDCTVTGGRVLRISRPRKKEFLQALTDHIDRSAI